jgi:hypothetical protein
MHKLLTIILLTATFLLLGASSAWAWGPGVHLNLGNYLLANLQLLAEPVANIVRFYPLSFLYGCLSADILVGKGKRLTPNHCHSWEAGFRLIRSVQEPHLKAYGMGYLSHLAADVVAHNYYVPNILQLGAGKGRFSHVYIEMQADRKTDFSKAQLKQIVQSPLRDADASLWSILQKSKVTFSFKKKIFQGSMALSRRNGYDSSLDILDKTFPQHNCQEYLDHMRDLSLQVVVDCLNQQRGSVVTQYDPMGFENLGLVKKVKKSTTRFRRQDEGSHFFLPSINLLSL